jgi:hypothetical protein
MKTLARIVLAWLVVVALPVQGYAAAAMLSCGPGHGRMAGAVEAGPAHAWHGAHGTAAPEATGHAAAHGATASGATAPEASNPDASARDASAALAAAGAFKCSACAACCVATALPASPVVVAALRPAAEAIPERLQPSGDFVVERLEHPPRGVFA